MTAPHTHIWTVPDEHGVWTCVSCPETSPTCIVERPSDEPGEGHPTGTSLPICHPCHDTERHVLTDIAAALGHWQHQPRSLVPAIRYDRDRGARGPAAGPKDGIEDPGDVADVLWSWADMWAEARDTTADGNAIDWLTRHLQWAAGHPQQAAWEDYRAEIRRLRHAARRVAHLLPKRHHGPCVHCGGRIVQDWADEKWRPRPDGLSDQVRCTGCGLTWRSHGAWMYTNRHTLQLLPDIRPDALVTLEDARRIFPHVPPATWRSWLLRDNERADAGDERRMPQHGTDVRGRALYRLADLTALVEHRGSDTRVGRRAG